MKPRIPGAGLPLFKYSIQACGKSLSPTSFRHASSSASSPPKQRLWLRLTVVTATAAAIGAYVRSKQNSENSTLSPARFTKYDLVSREPVSSTCSIFTLRPSKPGDNLEVYDKAWQTGVWSVMFKQPQLQIGRDYTPLPPTTPDLEDDDSLRFLIRKDPFGEVSRYLHGLKLGTQIEIRGPKIECEIPSHTQEILFIAGGTGIAPALQAGHTLLSRTTNMHKPRIHILWASRKREDCLGGLNDSKPEVPRSSWFSGFFGSSKDTVFPPVTTQGNRDASFIVHELEALKSQYPGQITVDYFVDEESSFVGKKSILGFTESSRSLDSQDQTKLIMISGPEGFINYMAGPKVWAEGMELQGPLQGIIKELNLKGWTVWKL